LIKQLQSLAYERCYDKVIPLCSDTGEKQYELAKPNCYVQDAGCGYPYVDEVMMEYRENKISSLSAPTKDGFLSTTTASAENHHPLAGTFLAHSKPPKPTSTEQSAVPTPWPLSNITTTTNKFPRLTEGWWTPYTNSSSRVYSKWDKNPYEWCILQEERKTTDLPPKGTKVNGILYVKSYKASSSTGTAVNNAIANHVAQRKQQQLLDLSPTMDKGNASSTMICRHYSEHPFGDAKSHNNRTLPSLLCATSSSSRHFTLFPF
jgi:hypothetical protein